MWVAETTMKLVSKIMLGAAAVVVASAASFPNEIGGLYLGTPALDTHKREALAICQQSNLSFVRFFASDREDCYARMRIVSMPGDYSGLWSKPNRTHPQYAQSTR